MPDSPDFTGSGPGLDWRDFVDPALEIGGAVYDWATGGNGNGVAAPGAIPPTVAAPRTAPRTNGGASGQAACCGQTMVPIAYKQIASCPPGYVAVDTSGDGRTDACVIRSCARQYGWRPAAKPPIKASDWKGLRKAASTIKKLDRVVKMGNAVVGKKPYRRTSGSHSHR